MAQVTAPILDSTGTSFAAREEAGASERANGPMVARVSGSLALGHQRRGIAGASSIRLFAGQNGLGDALGTRFSRRAEVGPAPRQSGCTGPARIMALAEGRPEDDKVVPIRR